MPKSATQVLICGAGPTGLVLAIWLNRLGVRVRIIDKAAEPGTTSRALVVHARTLEFYRQVGLAEQVVRRGLPFVAANLWAKGRQVGHVEFGAMGKGLSPFPYMLILPQDAHERLLIEHLAQVGLQVERPTELLDFEEVDGGRIRARLRRADGTDELFEADFLAGCDGARSRVREVLGIEFPGSTYEHLFYVADVQASGPVINRELHVVLDEADFLAVFPLAGNGNARLVGTVRAEATRDLTGGPESRQSLTWDDVSKGLIDRLRIQIDRLNWFSTYHVHHRVAERFRRGRAFLLGDAAHIHSPVGGQGMNTGIGDAVNLAWKLAMTLGGNSNPRLLDTYESERIAFARRLVATTDRAFTLVTSRGQMARFVRVEIAPRLLPALFRLNAARRFMFRTLSQTAIRYRDGWLAEAAVGRIASGDRLPWVPASTAAAERSWMAGDADNFTTLRSLGWQVHIYGACPPVIEGLCQRRGLDLHTFPWTALAHRAGLKRDALYLVRPDGYVAFADADADPKRVETYLDTKGMSPRDATITRAVGAV